MATTLETKLREILEEKDTKIIPENIKKGIQIFDIEGALEQGSSEGGIDTSDATAGPSDIISPKTAYANGKKITGTIKTNYISEYAKLKEIQQSNVLDFNDIIAVCGTPRSKTISVYKVKNEVLTDAYDITLSSLGIPEKYTLFSASISKVPVAENIYNIGVYVCDISSTRAADQMLYVIRFDISEHAVISSGGDLSKMVSSAVSLDTTGNYVNCYGVIQSHPTNPNWFICGVGCNNTSGSYGRFHSRIIKFINNQATTLNVSLLASASSWTNTFTYIDLMPANDGAYTWIFIKAVKNGTSQFVGLFQYNETTNKLITTPFNEKTYGAGILNKDYYVYNNNQVVSFETGSMVATFPITLNWQKMIKYAGGNQFLLFDISKSVIEVYEYEAATNTVTLKQSYAYYDAWNVRENSGFMMVNANDLLAVYYDVSRQLVSVLSDSDSVIKSLEIKDKLYIDTSDATATAASILSGKTAYANDEKISGTMPDNGVLNYNPKITSQSIPYGFTSGGTIAPVTSAIDINIIPENIRKGATILSVDGTYEGSTGGDATSDGNLQAKYLLEGYTAVVDGKIIEGTMPNQGNVTITATSNDIAIPEGYYIKLSIPIINAKNCADYAECNTAILNI